jgi:hypothetical protein
MAMESARTSTMSGRSTRKRFGGADRDHVAENRVSVDPGDHQRVAFPEEVWCYAPSGRTLDTKV